MPTTGNPARAVACYDWSATRLGEPGQWPPPLRLATDLLLNTPLPMLLAWGADPVIVFNESYGALAGPGYGHAPGGSVPPVLPPPLAAGRAALERAWSGEPALQAGAMLEFAGAAPHPADLYFTPVRGADGAVHGVLCALASAAPAQQEPAAGGGALHILVVEDNLDSQYLVCEMLRAFGHEADGVAHPDDALARLAAARYDVLFSDLSLPGMSGVELARKALIGAPGLKVIFASGYGDTLLRHLEFPYLSLQKPYELDELQKALDHVARELHAGA
ncbi:MAG: response regulator [Massilia sp.]